MDERILVVEDESKLNRMICDYLAYLGYVPAAAHDGKEAVAAFRQTAFDLVILDRMLPGMDGLEVARTIRAASSIPILMLTAKAEEADKVEGLDTGADDYVTKPFGMKELSARVRALLRRSAGAEMSAHGPLQHRDIVLDPFRRSVSVGGRPVRLTQLQFDILAMLMREPGRVFTRLQLLESAQEPLFDGYERTIDVHIKNIRKLIEPQPGNPSYIVTVRGVGYKLEEGGGRHETAPMD